MKKISVTCEKKNVLSKFRRTVTFMALLICIAAFPAVFAEAADGRKSVSKNARQNLQKDITVTATVGIDDNGYFKDELTPVNITLNNGTDGNFEGQITVRNNYRPQLRIINVFAGPHDFKKYTVDMKLDTYSSAVRIGLINSGGVEIYNESVNVNRKYEQFYYVVSVSESSSFFGEVKTQSISPKPERRNGYNYGSKKNDDKGVIEIIKIRPDEMFGNPACYAPYSLLILNGADISTLKKEQESAVIDYVTGGGALLVSYGGFISKFSGSQLASILPVSLKGSEVVDGAAFYKSAGMRTYEDESLKDYSGVNVPLTVSEAVKDARTPLFIENGGRRYPLIAHRRLGAGMVYFTAFNIAEVDLSQVRYVKENIISLIKQSAERENTSLSALITDFSNYGEFFDSFRIDPPSPYQISAVLMAFAALVGPCFYFFIRRNATFFKIIMYPTFVSVACFFMFNSLGSAFTFDKPQVNETGFQIVDNSIAKARCVKNISILQPPMSRGFYNVDMQLATVYNDNRGYSADTGSELVIDDDMAHLIGPRMGYTFTRNMISQSYAIDGNFGLTFAEAEKEDAFEKVLLQKAAERLEGDAAGGAAGNEFWKKLKDKIPEKKKIINGGELKTVVNNTDFEFQNCFIAYEDKVMEFDRFMPGDKIEFLGAVAVDRTKVSSMLNDIIEKNRENRDSDDGENGKFRPLYNLNRPGYSHRGDFINALADAACEWMDNTPILVGFVKKNVKAPCVLKSEGCDIKDSGTITVVRLR